MQCTHCSSEILDDCHYCPVCGKPTPLSAEASAAQLNARIPDASIGAAVESSAPLKDDSREKTEEQKGEEIPLSPHKAPVVVLDSKAIHTLLAQANLFRLRRQWEEATEQCIGILRAEPGNQAAHSLLGDIYRDQDKTEDAIRWYQMAVDLQPNASDEAKLHKMEQAQAQQVALAERRKRAGYAQDTSALPEDGGQTGGTAYLMNMSPRRWLRGITITSLAFLIVMLVVLIQTHAARRSNDVVPHSLATDGASFSVASGNMSDPLPPARLGGGVILPSGEQQNGNPASSSVGGSGLPPDLRSPGATSAPVPSGPAPEPPKTIYQTHPDIPTAAVSGVRPMAGPANPTVSIPGMGNSLTGGMTMGGIHDEGNDGNVSVIIIAQDVSGPGMRDHAIRNIIRAARTAFSNNSRLNHAIVTIQTSSNAAEGRVLMRADVERSAIASVEPDAEALDALERRIQIR